MTYFNHWKSLMGNWWHLKVNSVQWENVLAWKGKICEHEGKFRFEFAEKKEKKNLICEREMFHCFCIKNQKKMFHCFCIKKFFCVKKKNCEREFAKGNCFIAFCIKEKNLKKNVSDCICLRPTGGGNSGFSGLTIKWQEFKHELTGNKF